MKGKHKNIFKSFLALTLAFIMVLGAAPLSALADVDFASLFAPKAEAATYDIYTYEVYSDGTITITDCKESASGAITIPSKIDEKLVTSIGFKAFYNCTGLTSITIPNSVTSIGDWAFEDCTGLTSINVASDNNYYSDNNGVLFNKEKTELIKYPAGKSQTSYTIPNSVTSIGHGAFGCCTSLTSITIPNSVTSIGDWAFAGCTGLTSITIPNSVTSIGDWAFYGCTGLTSITIPNSVTSIGISAFDDCSGLTSITIPNSVTSIGEEAFACCTGLTSITIPDSVTSIGEGAFFGCTGLTSITIPDSVTSIGGWAFDGCTGLTSINVASDNNYYSDNNGVLFNKKKTELIRYPEGKSQTSYTIPNSVTSIGDDAFYGCSSLKSVTIPNSVTSIGYWAFHGCTGLTSITIPDSVTSIGEGAFFGCTGLTSITIPDSVTSIGEGAFFGCTGLTSITIPNSVTSIGYSAFSSCSSLTSITIPNGVTSIGISAFDDCSGLTSITIPNSVTSIGYRAFWSCTSLKDVYYTGSKDDWKAISVYDYNSSLLNATIHYNWTGEHGGTNNEPGSNAPFNQPTYIADIWSGNRKEKTPEHEQLLWYYNGYKPITRTIVEEMGDTAFKVWDGVKYISNPANGAKIALDKEKQRELIIFDAIRDVLGSPEFSDIISTSAARDLVGWTKSLNSAAKKIYGAEGIKNFEDFYNKYGKNTSNGKTKTKALVEAAYEDYQQDVGAVNCLSDLLTCVDSVLKIAKSSKEVINAFVNCMMVARMRESLKAVIDEMYAQSTDSDMRTALGNVKNYCVSGMNALRSTMVRSVAGIGVTVLKEFVGDFWGDLANIVPIVGPIIKGVQIGAAVGEGICNMLFSTGNTRDNYYLAKSTVEFVDIARKASLSLQKKYSANRTTEAANAYIDSVRFYISALNIDAENGRKFCDTAMNEGLINGVSNWLNGGNADYDEVERCTESIQNANTQFVELISVSWIFAENYLKTDYPEMYDVVSKNVITNPKYASTITQVKVGFDGKATVYFNVPSYAAGFKAASGVQVQYKKNNGSYSTLADLSNPYTKSVSHSVTLSNSDTYTYRVRTYAKLTNGKTEYSDWSKEYTTTANPAETPTVRQVRVGATGNEIWVNSTAPTGFNYSESGVVTAVEIYRRRAGESSRTKIKTVSNFRGGNAYTDTSAGSKQCFYSARSVVTYKGKTYYSAYSPEVSAIRANDVPKKVTLDLRIRTGGVPSVSRIATQSDSPSYLGVELSWTKLAGVTSYEICRKPSYGTVFVTVGTVDGETTSFTDTTVSDGGSYEYIIRFYKTIDGRQVVCGESNSVSVLVERVAKETEPVTIKNGKTATLSINSGNLADGATVSWSTSSDCVTLTPSEDGTSCEMKANSKGNATVTVTITYKDGSTVSDTFEIEAKGKSVFATIFDVILAPFRAIINLFKKLFGK